LTSMKKAVKMKSMRRRFPRKRIPEKFRRERLALLAKSDPMNLRKKKPSAPTPTRGRRRLIWA